jgi:ABC-type Fe3+-hydroxamate transport system substrate-binding protein
MIGGTKNPHVDRIMELKPDLVIANKEENKSRDIQMLRGSGLNVFVTSAVTVEEACEEMMSIEYLLLQRRNLSMKIISSVMGIKKHKKDYSFIYLIWDNPLMAAGPNTYISNLIEYTGGRNLIPKSPKRYPMIKPDEIVNLEPDFLFLPDEPYEFKERDHDSFSLLLPKTSILLIDGKLASWYNQRIRDGCLFFSKL